MAEKRSWRNLWCDRRSRREDISAALVLVFVVLWYSMIAYANEIRVPVDAAANINVFTIKEILSGWAKTIMVLVGAIVSIISIAIGYVVNDLKNGQRRIEDKLDLKMDSKDCERLMAKGAGR